jgi:hypothetical protein
MMRDRDDQEYRFKRGGAAVPNFVPSVHTMRVCSDNRFAVV